MLISVVIPVYNIEQYLKECIDSVLRQDTEDIEIVLVNDGSQDSSKEICTTYEKEYKNIKVINKKNGGLSDARNVGVENSIGDYIIFLDSDDYWNCNFIKEIYDILKGKEYDLILFDLKKFYQKSNFYEEEILDLDNRILGNLGSEKALEYILSVNKDFAWYACRVIVKREILIANDLYFEVGRSYEDVLWTPSIILNSSKIFYYKKKGYIYRLERSGQITSNITYKNLLDSIHSASYWHKNMEILKIDEKIKEKILKNISVRYFYSIWFLEELCVDEKKLIYDKLKKYKYILQYTNSNREKITAILVKVIGFRKASKVFKFRNQIKNKV